jgi:hypothetical protein
VRGEFFFHELKRVRMQRNVAVYENDNVTRAGAHAAITSGGRTAPSACQLD